MEKKKLEFKRSSSSSLSLSKSHSEKAPKIVTPSSSLSSLLSLEGMLSNPAPVTNPDLLRPILYVPIPALGMIGAPFFNRKNVTYFLQQFRHLCEEHGIIDSKGILGRLPDYCSLWVGD